MHQGDIIEIIHHDENCRKNVRRVKVKTVRQFGALVAIVGTNMKGKNSINYTLPAEPATRIVKRPGFAWLPFDDSDNPHL